MEQLFGVRTVVLVTAFFAFLVFMSFLNYKRNLAEFKRVALGLFGCWCFFLFILTMHSSLVEELKSLNIPDMCRLIVLQRTTKAVEAALSFLLYCVLASGATSSRVSRNLTSN
jgi:hypothetical protein